MTKMTRTSLIEHMRDAVPPRQMVLNQMLESVEFEEALEERGYASLYFNHYAHQLMGGDTLPYSYDAPDLSIEAIEPFFAQIGVGRAHLSRFTGTAFSLNAPFNDGGWVLLSIVCNAFPKQGQGTGSVPLVHNTDLLWVQLNEDWRRAQ
ncbi:hypothetical protein H10PHJ05_11 [Aeromonas phage HJ05]|nr:hypothetical protein H10PHJ05_11 [Aeromonas phage HJ05]